MKLLWLGLLLVMSINPTVNLIGVMPSGPQSLHVVITLDDPSIRELQPTDLEVWVDEQRVEIHTITPITTTPASPTLAIGNGSLQAKSMSIGIVVDLSTLLDPDKARALTRQWLDLGRAATTDRISLFIPPPTTSTMPPTSNFTPDRNQVINELEQVTPIQGATHLNSTIQHAIDATYLDAMQHDGLGYLVVISDGGDPTPQPLVSAEKPIPVIALAIGEESQLKRYAPALQSLAFNTKGRYLLHPDHDTLHAAYGEIAQVAQVHGFRITVENLPEGATMRLSVHAGSGQQTTLTIPLHPATSLMHRLGPYWIIALPGMVLIAAWGAKESKR